MQYSGARKSYNNKPITRVFSGEKVILKKRQCIEMEFGDGKKVRVDDLQLPAFGIVVWVLYPISTYVRDILWRSSVDVV
jgi:hypothetical protein